MAALTLRHGDRLADLCLRGRAMPRRGDGGRAEVISLQTINTKLCQRHGVIVGFHKFGHREHVKLLRDGDDRTGENLIVSILCDAANELAVDLEYVELLLL